MRHSALRCCPDGDGGMGPVFRTLTAQPVGAQRQRCWVHGHAKAARARHVGASIVTCLVRVDIKRYSAVAGDGTRGSRALMSSSIRVFLEPHMPIILSFGV